MPLRLIRAVTVLTRLQGKFPTHHVPTRHPDVPRPAETRQQPRRSTSSRKADRSEDETSHECGDPAAENALPQLARRSQRDASRLRIVYWSLARHSPAKASPCTSPVAVVKLTDEPQFR